MVIYAKCFPTRSSRDGEIKLSMTALPHNIAA